MATYATPDDVAVKLKRALSDAEDAQVQVLLDEGEAVLLGRLKGLTDDVTSGNVSAVLVRKVLTDAVIRVLQNPGGVSSQTLGPESVSYGASSRSVTFLEGEWALLSPGDEYAIGSVRLGWPNYANGPYSGRAYDSEQWPVC